MKSYYSQIVTTIFSLLLLCEIGQAQAAQVIETFPDGSLRIVVGNKEYRAITPEQEQKLAERTSELQRLRERDVLYARRIDNLQEQIVSFRRENAALTNQVDLLFKAVGEQKQMLAELRVSGADLLASNQALASALKQSRPSGVQLWFEKWYVRLPVQFGADYLSNYLAHRNLATKQDIAELKYSAAVVAPW